MNALRMKYQQWLRAALVIVLLVSSIYVIPRSYAASICNPTLSIATTTRASSWSLTRSAISGSAAACSAGDTVTIGIPAQLSIPAGTTINLGALTGSVVGRTLALSVAAPGAISGGIDGQAAGSVTSGQTIGLTWTVNGTALATDTVTFSAPAIGATWFNKWTRVNTSTTTLSGITSPVLPQDGIQFTMRDRLSAGQTCKSVNMFVYSSTGIGTWAGRGRCSADGTTAESLPSDFLTWSAGRKDPHAGSYILWLIEASITNTSVASYADEATISSSYYPTATVSASVKAPSVATKTPAGTPPADPTKPALRTAFTLETFDGDLRSGDRDRRDQAKSIALHSAQTVRVTVTNTGDDSIQLISHSSQLRDARSTTLIDNIPCTPTISRTILAPHTTFNCELQFTSPDEASEFILATTVEARSLDSGTTYHATDEWHARSESAASPILASLPPAVAAIISPQGKPNWLFALIVGLCTSALVAALLLLGYYRRRRHHPRRWHAYHRAAPSHRHGLRISARR